MVIHLTSHVTRNCIIIAAGLISLSSCHISDIADADITRCKALQGSVSLDDVSGLRHYLDLVVPEGSSASCVDQVFSAGPMSLKFAEKQPDGKIIRVYIEHSRNRLSSWLMPIDGQRQVSILLDDDIV